MVLSSTYQSTSLPLLSTLYEPPPKHLISVLEAADLEDVFLEGVLPTAP